MCLTQEEINHIKYNVNEVFGVKNRVFLFGSRVDDTKKGGDIDLLIEPSHLQVRFSKLQDAMGQRFQIATP